MTDDKETDGYYEKIKNGTLSSLNYVYNPVKNATSNYVYEPVKNTIDKGKNWYESKKRLYRNGAFFVAAGLILWQVGALKFIGSVYRRQGMVLRELVGVRDALGKSERDLTRMRQLLEKKNMSKTKSLGNRWKQGYGKKKS